MLSLARIPERNYRIKAELGNFRGISESLFGLRGEGLWVMLHAYFDESGTHSDSPIVVVAGLAAEVRQWEKFVIEWKRILCDVGLPYFHAADFSLGADPFDHLSKAEKTHLMIRLTNTIRRRVAFRVWTAIVMDDYRQLFSKDTKEEKCFGLCAFGCASRLRWLAMQKSDSYRIPYTFEHGGKGSHHAFKAFETLLDGGHYAFYRNASLTISSRLEMIPLQAADLHSYEVYKYFAD